MTKLLALVITLLMIIPTSMAQDSDKAQIRIVNLVPDSTNLEIADTENNLLGVAKAGTISEPISVSTAITGYSYTLMSATGVSSGFRGAGSTDAIFTADHDYLVMMLPTSDGNEIVILDLTASFGASSTATGLGKLIIGHYVSDLSAAAYLLADSDGNPIITQFFNPDFAGISTPIALASLGLAPETYQLSAISADASASVILSPQSLTLAADEITVLLVSGSDSDGIQAHFITQDGLTQIKD